MIWFWFDWLNMLNWSNNSVALIVVVVVVVIVVRVVVLAGDGNYSNIVEWKWIECELRSRYGDD